MKRDGNNKRQRALEPPPSGTVGKCRNDEKSLTENQLSFLKHGINDRAIKYLVFNLTVPAPFSVNP